MTRARVTIRDVARRAGVVPSTVSRVIHGYPDVSDETRRRVQDAIATLKFRPSSIAQSFRRNRTHIVSVILPRVDGDFYAALVSSIDAELEARDMGAALYPLLSKSRLDRYQKENAAPYHSDGLIFLSLDPVRLFDGNPPPTNLPIIVIDTFSRNFDSVTVDNRTGGYIAGQVLCERPAPTFVVLIEEWLSTPFASGVFSQRFQGFKEALRDHGIEIPPDHVISIEYSWAGGRLAGQRILGMSSPPFNVFASCDLLARGLIDEFRAAGHRIGADIRIIGFDGAPWTEDAGLTTIRQPIEQMAQKGVELLFDRARSPGEGPRHIQLAPVLIRRDTA